MLGLIWEKTVWGQQQSIHNHPVDTDLTYSMYHHYTNSHMGGSRKFCRGGGGGGGGSNFDFFSWRGEEDLNSTIIGPSSARQRNSFYSNYCSMWTFWPVDFENERGAYQNIWVILLAKWHEKNAVCDCGISWSIPCFSGQKHQTHGPIIHRQTPFTQIIDRSEHFGVDFEFERGAYQNIWVILLAKWHEKKSMCDCGISWSITCFSGQKHQTQGPIFHRQTPFTQIIAWSEHFGPVDFEFERGAYQNIWVILLAKWHGKNAVCDCGISWSITCFSGQKHQTQGPIFHRQTPFTQIFAQSEHFGPVDFRFKRSAF